MDLSLSQRIRRNRVSGFNPSDVTSASIHRWLRKNRGQFQEENSGLGSTPSGTGDVVGRWEDFLLGHAQRMSQGTTSLKPVKQADGSVRFDGVDDFLEGDYSGLSSAGHIFIRLKITLDPPIDDLITGLWDMSATAISSHFPFDDSLIYEVALTTSRKNSIATPDSLAVFHTWSVSSKASEWIGRYNSTIYHNTSTNTFSSPPATAELGRSRGTERVDGNIVEALLFDAVLSAADLTSMLDYMAAL